MKVARLYSDAKIPTRNHKSDVGLDLYFMAWQDGRHGDSFETTILAPGEVRVARTGITIEIPKGYFLWIANKSRSNFLVGGGIVDPGYQGELMVKLFNPTNAPLSIREGMAIAQVILLPCILEEVVEVYPSEIHTTSTARGTSGGIHRAFPGGGWNHE